MSFGFLVAGTVRETPVEGYDRPSVPRYILGTWDNNIIYKFYFLLLRFIPIDVNVDAIIDLLPISPLVVQNCKYLRNDKMWNYVECTF